MTARRLLAFLILTAGVMLPAPGAQAACTPDATEVACVEAAANSEETLACAQASGKYDAYACAGAFDNPFVIAIPFVCAELTSSPGPAGGCVIVFLTESSVSSYVVSRAPVAGCTAGFVILDPEGGSDYGIEGCS